MNLKELLEQVTKDMQAPAVSELDLRPILQNIKLYYEYNEEFSEGEEDEFIENLIRMMQDLSRKIPGSDKYEGFVRKLADKDKRYETLQKIQSYTENLLKTRGENP